MSRWRTYTAYSIGCAIVWLVIMALVIGLDPVHTQRIFWLVGGGWWIGGYLPRSPGVYPPTKAQRRAAAA